MIELPVSHALIMWLVLRADDGTCAGKETVNSMYGTRVAVLAGDFLFAESSWGLAQLDNLEVWLFLWSLSDMTVASQVECVMCHSCLRHIQRSLISLLPLH